MAIICYFTIVGR